MKSAYVLGLTSLLCLGTAGAQTPHELDLAWDDPPSGGSPTVGYNVFFDDDGPPQLSSPSTDVGLVNVFTFPNPGLPLPTDDEYFLGVQAYSVTGLVSGIPSIRIVIEVDPPGDPQNVRVLEIRPIPPAEPFPDERDPAPEEPDAVPTVRFRIDN